MGGGEPVLIQSMTTTQTHDIETTVKQIQSLEAVGCDLIRVAVPDEAAARAIPAIKREIEIPLIADIHFDHKLALLAIEGGADKIRLNPGNMGPKRLAEVARELKDRRIPVRIGVNSGSIEKELRGLYENDPPSAIAASAEKCVALMREAGIEDIVVSLKSADVDITVAAYQRFAEKSDLPLHLGITEAGPGIIGATRSAIGLSKMLEMGLGDTMRVSLTDRPENEVVVAREILRTTGLRNIGLRIVSCPSCGRVEDDFIPLVKDIEDMLFRMNSGLTLALMGCEVNGPGEARDADIGLAVSGGKFVLFKKGRVVEKDIPKSDLRRVILRELNAGD